MITITEKKSFGIALALWFFTGIFGGHRVYIEEKVSTLLWYWFVAMITFGIFPLVDAFLIKNKVLLVNNAIDERERIRVVMNKVEANEASKINSSTSETLHDKIKDAE